MKHHVKLSVFAPGKGPEDCTLKTTEWAVRKKLLDLLFGPLKKVTIVVPGDSVEHVTITEVEGNTCEQPV